MPDLSKAEGLLKGSLLSTTSIVTRDGREKILIPTEIVEEIWEALTDSQLKING